MGTTNLGTGVQLLRNSSGTETSVLRSHTEISVDDVFVTTIKLKLANLVTTPVGVAASISSRYAMNTILAPKETKWITLPVFTKEEKVHLYVTNSTAILDIVELRASYYPDAIRLLPSESEVNGGNRKLGMYLLGVGGSISLKHDSKSYTVTQVDISTPSTVRVCTKNACYHLIGATKFTLDEDTPTIVVIPDKESTVGFIAHGVPKQSFALAHTPNIIRVP